MKGRQFFWKILLVNDTREIGKTNTACHKMISSYSHQKYRLTGLSCDRLTDVLDLIEDSPVTDLLMYLISCDRLTDVLDLIEDSPVTDLLMYLISLSSLRYSHCPCSVSPLMLRVGSMLVLPSKKNRSGLTDTFCRRITYSYPPELFWEKSPED